MPPILFADALVVTPVPWRAVLTTDCKKLLERLFMILMLSVPAILTPPSPEPKRLKTRLRDIEFTAKFPTVRRVLDVTCGLI